MEGKHISLLESIICITLLFHGISASAYTVPAKIPVQGRLTNASTGVVLSGEYNFTFRIYNASTSGTLLWDENQTLTVDGNGLWNALLGNNTSLSLNFSEDTYLEVELNHDGSPLPRVQLGSTPYAERTDTASNLSCTNCLGTTEIEDVYLLNSGDNATGDYMFNGSFKIENSSGSPLLFVNSSDGNVGVGTTSPGAKLDIGGGVTGVSPSPVLRIANYYDNETNASISHIKLYDNYGFGIQANTLTYISDRYHKFYDSGNLSNPIMTLNGDTGNVGIGTANPGDKLHVIGSASTGIRISDSNTSRGDFLLYPSVGGSNKFGIFDRNASLDRLVIDSSGNVGIGTISPLGQQHIYGASAGAVLKSLVLENHMPQNGSGTAIYMGFQGNSTNPYGIRLVQKGFPGSSRTGWFEIQRHTSAVGDSDSDWTTTFMIDTSGNVGIGTTSPGAKLELAGSSNELRFTDGSTGIGVYHGIAQNGNNLEVGSTGWGYGVSLIAGANGGSQITIGYTGTPLMVFNVGASSPGGRGNVGIGTTSPNKNLVVVGDANITGNLYVSGQQMTVPDYVFEEGYDLMTLPELDTYIRSNKHLPGISPANETSQIDVVGQQQKLLEKIEELTLYAIEQGAEIGELRGRNELLGVENVNLRERVERLESLVCRDYPEVGFSCESSERD